MNKYFFSLFAMCSLICNSGLTATVFWCDAKERDHSQFDDVPVFKALIVKQVRISNDVGSDKSIPYTQNSKGLFSIDSSEVKKADFISIVFQDASGREYHVDRWPSNDLRMYLKGNPLIIAGFKYLGISVQVTDNSNDFILNCKSEL